MHHRRDTTYHANERFRQSRAELFQRRVLRQSQI